jgi:hypothetical protein
LNERSREGGPGAEGTAVARPAPDARDAGGIVVSMLSVMAAGGGVGTCGHISENNSPGAPPDAGGGARGGRCRRLLLLIAGYIGPRLGPNVRVYSPDLEFPCLFNGLLRLSTGACQGHLTARPWSAGPTCASASDGSGCPTSSQRKGRLGDCQGAPFGWAREEPGPARPLGLMPRQPPRPRPRPGTA